MLRRTLTFIATLLLFCAAASIDHTLADDIPPVATLAEPGISPDRTEIAFVSGGDVWSVASGGGVARLLADTEGSASRPLFSPDGRRLAFVSTRAGSIGIDVVDLAGGALRRITYDDIGPTLDAWSSDGRYLYFTSSARTITGAPAIRRVRATGGTPMDVRAEAYVYQMDAAPSPDGRSLAYVRNGFEQWWRRGHSHIDEGSITLERDGSFRALTNGDSKVRWPMWSPDGASLYFVSDRTGTDELWIWHDGTSRPLTHLAPGRVLWPTISRDGRTIAFERDMQIWTYDTGSGETHRLSIELRGLSATVPTQRRTLTSGFRAFDLSPDGKKLAFVGRANVFAADAMGGGSSIAVPERTIAAADEPTWNADSRRIAYVRDSGDTQAIVTYTFPDGPERVVTPPGHHDDYPHWSPDGTKLEFVRDGTEIHIVDAASGEGRIVASGTFDRRPFGDEDDIAFSPDGAWLAFVDNPPGGFSNAYVVPTAGGTARAVTDLPNTNTGPLAWAPDGKRLYVVTSQRTEDGAVAQVDLTPQPPRFGEDTFRSSFVEFKPKPSAPETPPPAAKPKPSPASSSTPERGTKIRIDFDGIARRVTFLPTGLDVARISETPDSKTLVLDANDAGQQNLYSFSVDETSAGSNVATQLTNTSTQKSRTRVSPDGKSVVYLDGGRFFRVGLDGKQTAPILVSADVDVDFERDKRIVFAQTWSTLDRWYADPHFNGVDWAAQRRIYEPYAVGAHTREEFASVMNLMIGELDSSHSGFREPPAPGAPRFSIGNLGVDFDAATYDRTGQLAFATIVPLGPIALAGGIKSGDVLLRVNDIPVTADADVNALLANTIGKRTELRIAPQGDAARARTVAVLPVDPNDDFSLRYHAWVEGRRAYVDLISGGRIGYVHLVDMEPDALRQFYTDLDVANREKVAVIVDIRNNEGGFVDPYALDVLARREYLRFRSRFGNDAPARTSLGQRALDRPTILVVNEHTLSDGEDFTQGYRQLKLGKVVGVPTAGWIIFTSSAELADGSQVRVPFTSVFDEKGVNMEQHPRRVDIDVDNTPTAASRGDDPQLEAAVKSLRSSSL